MKKQIEVDTNAMRDLIRRMRRAGESDDTETAHADADDLLCEAVALLPLGDELIKAYSKVDKWFA